MQPRQPSTKHTLPALAVAQAADLAAAYDGDASVAAHAALQVAQRQGDCAEVELWLAVCAIFEGGRSVEL